MGMLDDAKNKAQEVMGSAKEKLGDLTGSQDLESAGKQDQMEANVAQAGQSVKDAGQDAVDSVRDAVSDGAQSVRDGVEDLRH